MFSLVSPRSLWMIPSLLYHYYEYHSGLTVGCRMWLSKVVFFQDHDDAAVVDDDGDAIPGNTAVESGVGPAGMGMKPSGSDSSRAAVLISCCDGGSCTFPIGRSLRNFIFGGMPKFILLSEGGSPPPGL